MSAKLSRKNKGAKKWLSWLNFFFWALAIFVWGLIFWRSFANEPVAELEPDTDPIHVTGSRSAPPSIFTQNGTRSDSRLLPDEAYIVFIIDDFGPAWKQEIVRGFIDFPADITLSIIPGNRNSRAVAESAHDAGKELFVHLPMEPSERIALNERDMVWVKSDPAELRKVVERALIDVPYAVGINNHMGSKATANFHLMKAFATELKRRRLFFIDSRTSEHSEALRAMQEAGVEALGRDVFLDVDGDSATVAARIAETARIARKRGWAVAIGHVKQATLAAMSAALPELERQGFRLISGGELIRKLAGQISASM